MASRTLSAKLDDYWPGIRLQQVDIPASHLLIDQWLPSAASGLPTIEDANLLYLELKGRGRGATFLATTQRSTRYLISCLGARSLDKYSSEDAAQLRRYLIEKRLKTAVESFPTRLNLWSHQLFTMRAQRVLLKTPWLQWLPTYNLVD